MYENMELEYIYSVINKIYFLIKVDTK